MAYCPLSSPACNRSHKARRSRLRAHFRQHDADDFCHRRKHHGTSPNNAQRIRIRFVFKGHSLPLDAGRCSSRSPSHLYARLRGIFCAHFCIGHLRRSFHDQPWPTRNCVNNHVHSSWNQSWNHHGRGCFGISSRDLRHRPR